MNSDNNKMHILCLTNYQIIYCNLRVIFHNSNIINVDVMSDFIITNFLLNLKKNRGARFLMAPGRLNICF